jgi:hypothetical protein
MSSDLREVFVLLLQEPQPIDWEYYRKGIGAKVVDMYKEAYDSMSFFYSPSLAYIENYVLKICKQTGFDLILDLQLVDDVF